MTTDLNWTHRLDGIDGSHYQPDHGPVDLPQVKVMPTSVIWWKCSQSTSSMDPSFRSMRVLCKLAGFELRLWYHWLSSTTDPALQAHWYLSLMGLFDYGEGAMLDAEEKGITVEKCLAWLEAVEDQTHRPCDVYTGLYVAGGTIWKDSRIRNSKYGPRGMHLAGYTTTVDLTARMKQLGVLNLPMHFWQWSSTQYVPGITGHVDVNAVFDWDVLNACCGVTTAPPAPIPTPPTPTPPTTTKAGVLVMIANNKEKTVADDGTGKVIGFDPGAVKFAIMYDRTQPDGQRWSKDHLSPANYPQGLVESPLTNDQLEAIPNAK